MLVENDTVALLEIILVSDDADHARVLMTDLDRSRFPFTVTCISARRRIDTTLKSLGEARHRRLPVIVMLDFEFLQGECEDCATQIIDMKTRLAIECIVTRPPPFGQVVDRLKRTGAFLFDPDADVATPLGLLLH
jgi:hypothetical protein